MIAKTTTLRMLLGLVRPTAGNNNLLIGEVMSLAAGTTVTGTPHPRGRAGSAARTTPAGQLSCSRPSVCESAGTAPAPPPNYPQITRKSPPPPPEVRPLIEPLSTTEMRVLEYLPTHLTMAQIASELYVSLNTIRSHMRHLYIKLDTHRRTDTVNRARALGLLAPTPVHPARDLKPADRPPRAIAHNLMRAAGSLIRLAYSKARGIVWQIGASRCT